MREYESGQSFPAHNHAAVSTNRQKSGRSTMLGEKLEGQAPQKAHFAGVCASRRRRRSWHHCRQLGDLLRAAGGVELRQGLSPTIYCKSQRGNRHLARCQVGARACFTARPENRNFAWFLPASEVIQRVEIVESPVKRTFRGVCPSSFNVELLPHIVHAKVTQPASVPCQAATSPQAASTTASSSAP